jgi:two-component system response regulator FixJ
MEGTSAMTDPGRRPIAVIDDDAAVRDSLQFLLETAGYIVNTYSSATQFLADEGRHTLACLIVDQNMPATTGLELLTQLRERAHTIPALLITASPTIYLFDRAAALGAVTVLEKPLTEDSLLGFVATINP